MNSNEAGKKIKLSRSRRRVYDAPVESVETEKSVGEETPVIEKNEKKTSGKVVMEVTATIESGETPDKPIDREADAEKLIHRYMLLAGGVGILPSTILDIASLVGSQIALVSELASLYDIPFDRIRNRSGITSAVSALVTQGLMSTKLLVAIKMVPIIGKVASFFFYPALASSITYAVGKVFQKHFARGGLVSDFNPGRMKDDFISHMKKATSFAK